MKVVSMHHAVHNSPTDAIVFWLDADVSFREPLNSDVIEWIRSKDVTYIPFSLTDRNNYLMTPARKANGFGSYDMRKTKHVQKARLAGKSIYKRIQVYVLYCIP